MKIKYTRNANISNIKFNNISLNIEFNVNNNRILVLENYTIIFNIPQQFIENNKTYILSGYLIYHTKQIENNEFSYENFLKIHNFKIKKTRFGLSSELYYHPDYNFYIYIHPITQEIRIDNIYSFNKIGQMPLRLKLIESLEFWNILEALFIVFSSKEFINASNFFDYDYFNEVQIRIYENL